MDTVFTDGISWWWYHPPPLPPPPAHHPSPSTPHPPPIDCCQNLKWGMEMTRHRNIYNKCIYTTFKNYNLWATAQKYSLNL